MAMAGNDEFDKPPRVAVNVEPFSPEEADVLSPAELAPLGVSKVWLLDKGASIDCGTNDVELRPVVPPVSDNPVCVPAEDPPLKALLDGLPIVPVEGADRLDAVDAVLEDPLRPAPGMADGALRLDAAVEPGLVEDMPCVSGALADTPPTVEFANVFAGTHGADNPSRLPGVCGVCGVCTVSVWLGWPALLV